MVARNSISVGDHVRFTLGTTPIEGVVIDDRGPIGANRIRIFSVRIPNDPYDEDVIEMPEDELALASNSIGSIPKESIVRYLEDGGLIQILQSNKSGGTAHARVWLGRDSLGNVVHTFIAERGIVGGAAVPFFAIHDNRIFTSKLDEVLSFLSTFGLSTQDAKQVVEEVGTAP